MKKIILLVILFFNIIPTLKKGKITLINLPITLAQGGGEGIGSEPFDNVSCFHTTEELIYENFSAGVKVYKVCTVYTDCVNTSQVTSTECHSEVKAWDSIGQPFPEPPTYTPPSTGDEGWQGDGGTSSGGTGGSSTGNGNGSGSGSGGGTVSQIYLNTGSFDFQGLFNSTTTTVNSTPLSTSGFSISGSYSIGRRYNNTSLVYDKLVPCLNMNLALPTTIPTNLENKPKVTFTVALIRQDGQSVNLPFSFEYIPSLVITPPPSTASAGATYNYSDCISFNTDISDPLTDWSTNWTIKPVKIVITCLIEYKGIVSQNVENFVYAQKTIFAQCLP